MGDYAIERDMDAPKWCYLGEDENEHGVFTNSQMQQWFDSGYFNESLKVRTVDSNSWFYLREYMNFCNGGTPFNGNLSALKQCFNNEYYDQQRQQQVTPLPIHIPLHPGMIIPPPPNVSTTAVSYGIPTSATPGFYMTPNSSMNNGGGGGGASFGGMFPPGMESYNESSQIYKHDGYGNERENPSSSTLSETPDSERCLTMMEDMKISTPTFDKGTGMEDAPWLLKNVVDAGTDTPSFEGGSKEVYTQTRSVFVSRYEVKSLLKALTGLDYYIQ